MKYCGYVDNVVMAFPVTVLSFFTVVLHIRGKCVENFAKKSRRGKVILVITILDAILYFLVCLKVAL